MLVLLAICLGGRAHGNGLYDNGIGARSMAMGGADVAWAADPLGAMGVNPAGMGFLNVPALTLGATGGFLNGHFEKPGVSSGNLDGAPAALPEGAFAMPIPGLKVPVVVGLSFVPESYELAKWNYADPPGGLGGVSYGPQNEKSEFINLRSSLGVAVQVKPDFSFGASVGLIYNKNELLSP